MPTKLKALRAVFWILIFVLTFEFGTFAKLQADSWLATTIFGGGLVAVAIILSIWSQYFYGAKERWITELLAWFDLHVLSGPGRTTIVALLVLAINVAFSVYLYNTWPPPKNYLVAVVFEGPATAAKHMSGAVVRIRVLPDRDLDPQTTDNRGEAYFFGMRTDTQFTYSLTLREKSAQRTTEGGLPIPISKLPHQLPIDVSQVRGEDWRDTTKEGAPPPPSITLATMFIKGGRFVSRNATTGPTGTLTVYSRASTAERDMNAPWGTPLGHPDSTIFLVRQSYTAGFDPEVKIARWVTYTIRPTNDDIRRVPYRLDPELLPSKQAALDDYRGSGFDRGHLISTLDVAGFGAIAVTEANFMSVITPQVPDLNRGAWADLEQYGRELVERGQQIYIIAGPVFGGPVQEGKVRYLTVGKSSVAVPTHFFRILARGSTDATPDVLAFIVPNKPVIGRGGLGQYVVSLGEVETATRLSFFSKADQTKMQLLKSRRPRELW